MQRTIKHSPSLLNAHGLLCNAHPIQQDCSKVGNNKTVNMLNSLPDSTNDAGGIDVFRSRIKIYLFTLSFYRTEFFECATFFYELLVPTGYDAIQIIIIYTYAYGL